MGYFRNPRTLVEIRESARALPRSLERADDDPPAVRHRWRPTAWDDLQAAPKRSWKAYRTSQWRGSRLNQWRD